MHILLLLLLTLQISTKKTTRHFFTSDLSKGTRTSVILKKKQIKITNHSYTHPLLNLKTNKLIVRKRTIQMVVEMKPK